MFFFLSSYVTILLQVHDVQSHPFEESPNIRGQTKDAGSVKHPKRSLHIQHIQYVYIYISYIANTIQGNIWYNQQNSGDILQLILGVFDALPA